MTPTRSARSWARERAAADHGHGVSRPTRAVAATDARYGSSRPAPRSVGCCGNRLHTDGAHADEYMRARAGAQLAARTLARLVALCQLRTPRPTSPCCGASHGDPWIAGGGVRWITDGGHAGGQQALATIRPPRVRIGRRVCESERGLTRDASSSSAAAAKPTSSLAPAHRGEAGAALCCRRYDRDCFSVRSARPLACQRGGRASKTWRILLGYRRCPSVGASRDAFRSSSASSRSQPSTGSRSAVVQPVGDDT